jgi:hypothetical protein
MSARLREALSVIGEVMARLVLMSRRFAKDDLSAELVKELQISAPGPGGGARAPLAGARLAMQTFGTNGGPLYLQRVRLPIHRAMGARRAW